MVSFSDASAGLHGLASQEMVTAARTSNAKDPSSSSPSDEARVSPRIIIYSESVT
jgi:hypothetical protein